MKRGNRESTIKRKLRYLKHLKGSLEDMTTQVLNNTWKDRVKSNALDVITQYAEFLNVPYTRPNLRAYDNSEMYVPNPDIVKKVIYRVRSKSVRVRIMIAIETGGSSGEVWRLLWKDLNITAKTITITGIKGHRTETYDISDELVGLVLQLTKKGDRIFHDVSRPSNFNDSIDDYKKRLAKETGNPDFLKIYFHTFRHLAISWHYFKTKDIVST
jgi:integrase